MSTVFPDISGASEGPDEIESLCMNCEENGMTRMLLTKIPFFKEVIIMSFKCEHCGLSNNEIQPGSSIQVKGIRYTVKVNKEMMNRQIVKQASAKFRIEELDFEATEFTSRGVLTTIEGLFETAIEALQQQQPVRLAIDPDLAAKIDAIIVKLGQYKTGDIPFTLVLDDISGNSFIENPLAPKIDESYKIEHYERTALQNNALGLQSEELNNVSEVAEFETNCIQCNGPAPTRMKTLMIPHFKEVIIMATACDSCGYKTNEVKAGGAVEDKATRIEFNITDASDLNRDVLTSETCVVIIPELDVECHLSSNGGKFTTLEGLIGLVIEHLGTISPFSFGDSASQKNKLKDIVSTLKEIKSGTKFTKLVLDDPISNSFLQNTYAPDADPELVITKYERTHEQNETYGLNDMITENYT